MSVIARAAPAIITSRRRNPIITPRADTAPPDEPGGSFGLVGFQSWVEIGGVLYGAKPDLQGPIGGHEGYSNIVTSGDYIASTFNDIQAALNTAQAGEVVFVPGTAVVDFTGGLDVEVPAGVTLASDRGHNGSDGALFFSDTRATMHLVEIVGANVRISGLRIKGHDDYAQDALDDAVVGTARAIRMKNGGDNCEIDNCEIWNWIHACCNLVDVDTNGHHIHHNYFHHCWSKDQGYGVVFDQCGGSVIEYNLGNALRHFVAHTGRNPVSNPENAGTADYIARHNVSLDKIRGQMWDMHSSPEDPGTLGSNNGGRCGVATVLNNFSLSDVNFTSGSTMAYIQWRGTPYAVGCEATHNWISTNSGNWAPSQIFLLREEQYDCTEFGTCPVRNSNLWDGPDQTIVGTDS